MKKAIKVVALLTVLMTVAAGAWAYDDAQHVKVAPNGKGDLLIFPFYFSANGGWQTKISVINTAVGPGQWSTVAKVVIRTNYYSQEVLDFLLYLTPADVWTATITNDGTNTWLESTDDSMLAPNGQFASATNPVKIMIPNPKACAVGSSNKYNVDDSAQYGYIEVIEGWYGDVSDAAYNSAYQTGESRTRPVSKSFLYRVYSSLPNTIAPRVNVDATDRTLNILSGYMEFQNGLTSGYTSSMQASVFADWDSTSAPTSSLVTGITLPSRNTLGELEAALAKTNIAMPYVHQNSDFTVHVMTFPTKVSGFDPTSGDNYCRYWEGRTDGYGLVAPYWNDPSVPDTTAYSSSSYACPEYKFSNFDLSEGGASGPYSGQGSVNTLCREVNLLLSHTGFRTTGTGAVYAEGWTNYTFTRQGPTLFSVGLGIDQDPDVVDNHTYYGVPVIPSVLMFKKGSVSLMEGAYTNGHVYGREVVGSDPNADAISDIIVGTGIPAPGTAPTAGELPPYYDTATWATGWPMGGYAAPYAWLPEYQYSNVLPELGRDTY